MKNKFPFGILFLVLAVPLSLSLLYRQTNLASQAVANQTDTQDIPTPAPKPGELWVYDNNTSSGLKFVIYSNSAPTNINLISHYFNPLSNTNKATNYSVSANANECGSSSCSYSINPYHQPSNVNYWQYFELESSLVNQYRVVTTSSQWKYDSTNQKFYRTPIAISQTFPNHMTEFNVVVEDDLQTRSSLTFFLNQNSAILTIRGFAQGFTFNGKRGRKVQIFAPNISRLFNLGSTQKIEIRLYDPNKKQIAQSENELRAVLPEDGNYRVILETIGQRSSKTGLRVLEIESGEKNIFANSFYRAGSGTWQPSKSNDLLLTHLNPNPRTFVGREPFYLNLNFPQLISTNKQTATNGNLLKIQWLGRVILPGENNITTNQYMFTSKISVSKSCAVPNNTGPITETLEFYQDLEKNIVTVSEKNLSMFAPGYNYLITDVTDNLPKNWKLSSLSPSGLLTDIDSNGEVDLLDYSYMVSEFFKSGEILQTDIDCSGSVDLIDYSYLTNELGK